METKRDDPEPFQYMMKVDNGWVHGIEWSPEIDSYSKNDLQNEDKTPETLLRASDSHKYDFEYKDFTNNSVKADKVAIDAVSGIIDVHRNGDVIEQYSIVGILENDQGRPELIFGGARYDEKEVVAKTDNEIEWSPNLAAAYEAVYESIDFDRELEEESVPLYEEEEEYNVTTLDGRSVRETVKKIDDFIRKLGDPADGIADFEDRGAVTIDGGAHYDSTRGYKAAQSLKTDLNRLNGAGLLGYETESLYNNGDEKEVDLKIAREFLDGNGSLDKEVDGLSDFDIKEHSGREELADKRMF